MLRIDCFDDRDASPASAHFDTHWRIAQVERLSIERDGWWFETFRHPSFGSTIVLVGRPTQLRLLLKSTVWPEDTSGSTLAVVHVNWHWLEEQLSNFADDFAFSAATSRTVIALFMTGDVRRAAIASGISYETAREYLEKARGLVGASNLQRLITMMGMGLGRTAEEAEESDQFLAIAYGVSERQMRIAGMIANGDTRAEVAIALGISEALVKKEMAIVYAALDITTAQALARAMIELRLLAIAASLGDGAERFPEPAHRSLSIKTRDGRILAASDYGPRGGTPVLVLHSSMTSRPVNRSLVEALQNSGFRPISMDRPGFGGTELLPDMTGEDYFELAALDIVDLCAEMNWKGIAIVTRGAAQVVLALHEAAPDLIEVAVVTNPDPDATSSSRHSGFLATMKRNFVKRPWAIALMARWFAQSLTYERAADNVRRSTAGCPSDREVMARPEHMGDYYRSLSSFRQGRLDGFVTEQTALATLGRPGPINDTDQFILLVGEHDSIHDPGETMAYWREVLPDARVEMIEGAGRFMTYSHAEVVVAALTARLRNAVRRDAA
ncbi:alpha/beta hydrolase [Devosia sediminis]|uniref:Alpha/beta hydrolase n=1 Tax=Devosia sediminis TaxID=2798801 RepID=A0A934MT34_9HYPH|nr:alpha/beta hydrolase [Devosia sediminis]MBJ3787054.1 alpha/beta hydrolase [Devosia sediminis]